MQLCSPQFAPLYHVWGIEGDGRLRQEGGGLPVWMVEKKMVVCRYAVQRMDTVCWYGSVEVLKKVKNECQYFFGKRAHAHIV